MKLSETALFDDDRLIIKQTHDAQPYLDRAAMLRSQGATTFGEGWHVGTVPGFLLDAWLQEAGLTMDQTEEVEALLMRKLQSGEFSKLRVHEGRF
jgi:hypothetical protein